MDDDYNVINGVDDDDAELQYPMEDIEALGDTGLQERVNQENEADDLEINRRFQESGIESAMRARKRRLENLENMHDSYQLFSHPMDWHMRMSLVGEGLVDKKSQSAAKRKALEELEQLIKEAPDDQKPRGESQDDDVMDFFDDESGTKTIAELCDDEFRRRFHRRQEVMSTPPIDGSPWIGISGTECRVYVRLFYEPKSRRENLLESITSQMKKTSFGYRAYQEVVREAEEIRLKKLEAANKERDERLERIMSGYEENGDEMDVDEEGDGEKCSALWVNKYTASNFTELLSDDVVNRNLLTWLKLWDECVFKRKIDTLMASLDEKGREVFHVDSGKVRRPSYKVVLLAGPAGLGKTTLAGIIARQAGYSIVDVNASDARTVADLQRVLEGAVKTTRTLDADSRPCCLVLDEIDGAPVETIRHLVKAVQATGKKAIRRPIIGICNNLFAPSLRDLRAIALCIPLGPTKPECLTNRLQMICDSERIRCDAATLRRLCVLCANDMRHAINSLQWVAVAARKRCVPITTKLVQEVIERERSGTSSIFENWATILELNRHIDSKGSVKSIQERVRKVERVALDYGNDRFVSGLHANSLVPLPMGVLSRAARWFQFYDDIQKVIHSYQNYTPMRYVFAFYAGIHLLLATHARLQLVYPQTEQNMYTKLKESADSLDAVRAGGISSRIFSRNVLLIDVLPMLVRVCQPPIKPMNEQLYTQREQSLLNAAVAAMCDYGLTFVPLLAKDHVNYLFQPPIDVMTMFDLVDDKKRIYLANATRQLIAHKITLLRVNVLDHDAAAVLTNMSKIKELMAAEKQRNGTGNAKTKKNRRRSYQNGNVHFEFNGGDQNAVKKKITMGSFTALVFGSS